MNKTELIKLLRAPHQLTSDDLNELEEIIEENPYFLSARLLLAKGSKELKDPKTKKRITSAAVYSTDRILLKKYLSGDLFFLSKPLATTSEEAAGQPEKEKATDRPPTKKPAASKKAPKSTSSEQPKREDKRPSPLKKVAKKPSPQVPEVPSGHLDAILEELQKDMENLKASRDHFVEVQDQIKDENDPKQKQSASTATESSDSEVKAKEEQTITPEASSSSSAPEEALVANDSEIEEAKAASPSTDEIDSDEDAIISKKIAELTASAKGPEIEDQKEAEPIKKEEDEEPTTTEEKTSTVVSNVKEEKKTSDLIPDETPDDEWAERTIKEPRFSRFSTRSYLKENAPEQEEEDATSSPAAAEKKEKVADNQPSTGKSAEKTDKEEEVAAPVDSKQTEEKEEPAAKLPTKESENLDKVEEEKTTKPVKKKKESAPKPVKKKEDVSKEEKKKPAAKKATSKKTPATKQSDESTEKAKVEIIKAEKEIVKAEKEIVKAEKEIIKEQKEIIKEEQENMQKEEAKAIPEATEVPQEQPKTSAGKEANNKEPKKPAMPPTSAFMPKAKAVARKNPRKNKKPATETTSKKESGGEKSGDKQPDGKKDDGKSDRDQQHSIINKFIEESPSIKYRRTNEPTIADLAENSGEWDPELASEHLAEIYLYQGNKKRTIEIYKALSLKYPEKKSYFADLISKIE